MGRSQSLRCASSWVGLDTTIHSASGCTTTLLRWGRLRTINGLAQVYKGESPCWHAQEEQSQRKESLGKERKKEKKNQKKKELFLSVRLVISDLVEAYTCESPNLKIIIILLSAVKAGRSWESDAPLGGVFLVSGPQKLIQATSHIKRGWSGWVDIQTLNPTFPVHSSPAFFPHHLSSCVLISAYAGAGPRKRSSRHGVCWSSNIISSPVGEFLVSPVCG